MPVTVCLGGDPVYTYCASAPLPDGIDEYLLAGYLRNRPVELVRCLTNDLEVPADCDLVIEGYVDPAEEQAVEGPFGDHTGFYSLEDRYPVFHVTAITHRKNAVYPATLVGIPPQEDLYLGRATEAIFLAPIRLAVQPEIRRIHLPAEGAMHNIALLDIEKTYPGQAFKVAGAMWGAGQMMFNKFCVVTASGGSLSDPEVLRGAIRNVEIPRDVLFSKGPLDVLDHAAPAAGFGGKCCIDATPKAPEGFCPDDSPVVLPEKWTLAEGVSRLDDRLAHHWRTLLVHVGKGVDDLPGIVEDLLKTNAVQGIKFILAFDANAPLDDSPTLLWLASAHCDAMRDVAVVGSRALLFDARAKAGGVNGHARPWPNPTVMDPATVERVDHRWPEYGPGDPIPSPSLKYKGLSDGDGAKMA
jgi:4-hydroxy-3-polyprenylbenzoate decarboxylase